MMRYCKPIDWLKIKKETIAIKCLIIFHQNKNKISTKNHPKKNITNGQPKNINRNIIKHKFSIIFSIYKHKKQKIYTLKLQYMTIA